MYVKQILIIGLCFWILVAKAQQPVITQLDSSTKTSIRGLSVVNDKIVWCSGTNGMVAKSLDGGKTFKWKQVSGYEKGDFRDIEAFDKDKAIVMAIDEPAVILKTVDGGITWKKVFEDTTKGMFLDAMDFKNDKEGVVVGDPIDGKIFLAYTIDGGNTWTKKLTTKAEKGEAFFAASGGNIKLKAGRKGQKNELIYVTGGTKSKFYSDEFPEGKLLPIVQGKESAGANAIDIWGDKAVIVGGDFSSDTSSTNNSVLVNFTDKTAFSQPTTPPHGYRSSVVFIDKNTLIACGTSGVDISYDGGLNWQLVSKKSYHVVQKAKHGSRIFLAGSKGKIAVLSRN